MANQDQQAFSSFDPDDESDVVEPQERIEGWIKIQTHRGGTQVLQVKTVRVLERWALRVIRPGREDYPLYKSGFLWSSIERIPEEEALAFLAKRGGERRDAPEGQA